MRVAFSFISSSAPLRSGFISAAILGAALFGAACDGCKSASTGGTSSSGASGGNDDGGATSASASLGEPTLRVVVASDIAGALEPCGCVKDQLGGLDHAGAWLRKQTQKSNNVAFVAAGAVFFMDPQLAADRKEQDVARAETIAKSLADLGFAAFSPAKNDFAAGDDTFASLAKASGGAALVAASPIAHKTVNGVKVAFVGAPAGSDGAGVAANVKKARAEGARVVILLTSTGRGDAKRLAEAAPDLTAVVVGSPESKGEANTQSSPVERVGNVLVVEPANHLQAMSVIDLYVRGNDPAFADALGLERMQKREAVTRRIDDLRVKIAVWEKDPKIQKGDIDARKADVTKLEAERAELMRAPPPAQGSYFAYAGQEVRTDLGQDDGVKKQMLAYYKRVNDRNKELFKDKKPPAVKRGEASYTGIETCSSCHEDARAVWDKTVHAHAYKTLADEFKEFNLDCVSCHVTGYDKAGGSTVTFVKELKDVQCEVCHGPGSLHTKNPEKVAMPVPKPGPELCLSCHHPPHVHTFDAKAKMEEVLGPGHGKKK